MNIDNSITTMCNDCPTRKTFKFTRKSDKKKRIKFKYVERPKYRVLELFAGTGSVKKVCDKLGWECVSVDISSQFHKVDYEVDILKWDYTQLAKDFDIVWASPPCATFSKIKRSHIGRVINGKMTTPESIIQDQLDIGVPLLYKAIEIIDYFQPKYWIIENPQTGDMKNYLPNVPHYDVDYCRYSDWGYRKRTRFWTNITNFKALTCDRKCDNMVGGRHREGVTTMKSLDKRYRIPSSLIRSLFRGTY